MLPVFKCYKPFAGKIVFYINDRLSQQFLEPLFIWFESDAAMHKESKVWPDLVNIIQFVMINNHFHTHLAPRGNTYYKSNIPIGSLLYNLNQLFIPVLHPGNFS